MGTAAIDYWYLTFIKSKSFSLFYYTSLFFFVIIGVDPYEMHGWEAERAFSALELRAQHRYTEWWKVLRAPTTFGGVACQFWSSRALHMSSKDLISDTSAVWPIRDHPEEMTRKARSRLKEHPLTAHLPAARGPPSCSSTPSSPQPGWPGPQHLHPWQWPPGRTGLPIFSGLHNEENDLWMRTAIGLQ